MKAFPRGTSAVHEGMDLRDYFAAKAMQAIVSKSKCKLINASEIDPAYRQCAIGAYEYADAMMEARKK